MTTLLEHFQKSRKIVETCKIDSPTHKYMTAHFSKSNITLYHNSCKKLQ